MAVSRPASRRIVLFLVAIMLGGFVPHLAAQQPDLLLRADFEWSMPDRFGLDTDADGLIDLPNTPAYVRGSGDCGPTCPEPRFIVRFDASSSETRFGGAPLTPSSHWWEVRAEDGRTWRYLTRAPTLLARLPEGRYRTTMRLTVSLPSGRATSQTSRDVEVQDWLIVAIGDSYAAGDGNPERHRLLTDDEPEWADGVDGEAGADHAAAHRSTLAWPAQAALVLERSDRQSSVTLVSVAASGATIERGLLGPQNSSLPEAQVSRVAELVGERTIDGLLVSIGGNDVGFGDLIRGLVDADPLLDPICYHTDLANVWASVLDGDWNRDSRLHWTITNPFAIRCRSVPATGRPVVAGMAALGGELDRLAAAIERDLGPVPVFVMEYPDPTGHQREGAHELCGAIVDDAAPFGFHEISRSEQQAGLERVLEPLNATIRAASTRHGWTYVGEVAASFADGHGYCAPWPSYGTGGRDLGDPSGWYHNPGVAGPVAAPTGEAISWYRTAAQSAALQGGSRFETSGTLHPNELGQRAIAARFLAVRVGD